MQVKQGRVLLGHSLACVELFPARRGVIGLPAHESVHQARQPVVLPSTGETTPHAQSLGVQARHPTEKRHQLIVLGSSCMALPHERSFHCALPQRIEGLARLSAQAGLNGHPQRCKAQVALQRRLHPLVKRHPLRSRCLLRAAPLWAAPLWAARLVRFFAP